MNKHHDYMGTNFTDDLIKSLKNKKHARAFFEVSWEEYQKDHDEEMLLRCLKMISEANGGLSVLSEKTNVSRPTLSRVFSHKSKLTISMLGKILVGIGCDIPFSSHRKVA